MMSQQQEQRQGHTLSQGQSPARRHLRGLLYKEWLAHRNLIVGFWAVWLVCQLVLQLFNHPAWIFAFGLLYSILVAPMIAGRDAAEGSEEFAFSLPPTRSQIYLIRLALGGGNLLVMLLVSLLAIWVNLPQLLWSIAVESGFTEPFPPAEGPWYIFAFASPVALFAFTFVIAASAQSRAMVSGSWFFGALLAGAVAGVGLLVEGMVWGRLTSWISGPAMVAAAVAILFTGYQSYLRKEGISRPTPIGKQLRLIWLVLALVAVFLVFSAAMFWLLKASAPSESMPARPSIHRGDRSQPAMSDSPREREGGVRVIESTSPLKGVASQASNGKMPDVRHGEQMMTQPAGDAATTEKTNQ